MISRSILFSILLLFSSSVFALEINRTNNYDRWNRSRPVRAKTHFIVVHTTEANDRSSLNSLNNKGAANYLVDTSGMVHHIVPHRRVSNHAGVSMWDGIQDLNRKSVGIEFTGYHYKMLTDKQIQSGRELIRQLKSIYNISDRNVLTHSMVAYGKFRGVRYRGRKDCGLNLANNETRSRLGLGPAPKDDPDVPGRITGWDIHHQYLESFLYGDFSYYAFDNYRSRNAFLADIDRQRGPQVPMRAEPNTISRGRSAWTIARGQYNHATTLYTFPNGTVKRGDEINNWSSLPEGTQISFVDCSDGSSCQVTEVLSQRDNEEARPDFLIIGLDGETAWNLAQSKYSNTNTIYFIPSGNNRYYITDGANLIESSRYNINRLPTGTKILLGYVYGGKITSRRSPTSIAGNHWDSPSTLYYTQSSGRVLYGDSEELVPRAIPRGTIMIFKDQYN